MLFIDSRAPIRYRIWFVGHRVIFRARSRHGLQTTQGVVEVNVADTP